ncbi:hypothetical protein AN477_22850 [Alicyclobacillus ferrooxydans]|uniref:PqqD family protein n=1 Tax=Alicyclobacillus ferrooxydans TaxID=471514 RepID=A0A0P9C3M6_9BACL|nr:hypothetical protein AN477_22850 [Alicyclobacillus ferrooxydans]
MSCVYRWGAQVESVSVDEEWLVMDPENMSMTKLEDVAAFIWSRLQMPCTIDALVSRVVVEFDVSRAQAESDVVQFLNELQVMGLVERND